MQKIKCKQLIDPAFRLAFQQLMSTVFSIETSFQLLTIQKLVLDQQKAFETIRVQLLQQHAKKDETGALVVDESGQAYALEDKDAFAKLFNDLLEYEVNIPTIPMSWLKGANLSPIQLHALLGTVINPDL